MKTAFPYPSWLIVVCLLTILVMTGRAEASPIQTPTDSVKGTLSALFQILGNQDLNEPGRAEERRQKIERTLRDRLSYEYMAKRSLGRPWTELNHVEQAEFSDLFIRFLAKSLAGWTLERDLFSDGAAEISDDHVNFLSEQLDDRFSEVKTRMRGYKVDTMVDFRLVDQAGNWQVYDIVVDHMSISSNYRSQFASIMRPISLSELEEKIKKTLPILKLFELISPR